MIKIKTLVLGILVSLLIVPMVYAFNNPNSLSCCSLVNGACYVPKGTLCPNGNYGVDLGWAVSTYNSQWKSWDSWRCVRPISFPLAEKYLSESSNGCSNWQKMQCGGSCGAIKCGQNERCQIRTCILKGCEPELQCVKELNIFYSDVDLDGFGDSKNITKACVQPKDYVSNNKDCNDNRANINPNSREVCDGKDNNCNGAIDEENAGGCVNYYKDKDLDGFGANDSKCLCQPAGVYTSLQPGDCNDANSLLGACDSGKVCKNKRCVNL